MAVGGKLAIDRAGQLEVADDGRRAQIKHLLHGRGDLRVRHGARALRVDEHAHGLGHADGVGQLHEAALGESGGNDVLGHVARGVGGAAVDLRRVLAGERAAAVRGAATVGVDDDLAAGQTGVRLRAADDKAAGGVDEIAGLLVEQLGRDGRADDELDHVLAQLGHVDLRRVLRAEHDGVHAHGVILLVILDGDLRLAVGTQIVHQLLLAHGGQALGELVRERDRQRHELRRLVAGVAEHHALIARTVIERIFAGLLALERVVDAEGDVGALLVDVRDDGAGLAVKAVFGAVVADLAHGLAHDLRNVDVALGRDLAHDVHDAGRDRALAGDAAVRILRQDRVEDRVGDLIADLVGMPFGHGFGCKKMMSHSKFPHFLICRAKETSAPTADGALGKGEDPHLSICTAGFGTLQESAGCRASQGRSLRHS